MLQVLKQQILATWQANHKSNLILINALTDDALNLTRSPRGGGKIGHQLAHMYNVRYWQLEKIDKTMVSSLKTIKSEDVKTCKMLTRYHQISTDLIKQVLETSCNNNAKVKNFKSGLIPLLGYLISHEAHHRGNIFLTLKLSNFKLPIELKYGVWEWNKMITNLS